MIGDEETKLAIRSEVAPHLTKEAMEAIHKRSLNAYLVRRSLVDAKDLLKSPDKPQVLIYSVPELESRCESIRKAIHEFNLPADLDLSDLIYEEDRLGLRPHWHEILGTWTAILQRIGQAVYDYLSRTEQQLLAGQANADIFEQNRRFVNDRLYRVAPSAVDQLRAASERINAGGVEAWSQALASCRRVLKTIADHLYPPRADPVTGSDGTERVLTDAKFVSRLLQFVHENAAGTASRRLLSMQAEEFCGRIERLYELASKGVHTDVDQFEANQCVLQTYVLIGDLLRLHEGTSGLNANLPDIDEVASRPPWKGGI